MGRFKGGKWGGLGTDREGEPENAELVLKTRSTLAVSEKGHPKAQAQGQARGSKETNDGAAGLGNGL